MTVKSKHNLAMDFGASTGRGILGSFDGNALELEKVHRFENYNVNIGNQYYWDVFRLIYEIHTAL